MKKKTNEIMKNIIAKEDFFDITDSVVEQRRQENMEKRLSQMIYRLGAQNYANTFLILFFIFLLLTDKYLAAIVSLIGWGYFSYKSIKGYK